MSILDEEPFKQSTTWKTIVYITKTFPKYYYNKYLPQISPYIQYISEHTEKQDGTYYK